MEKQVHCSKLPVESSCTGEPWFQLVDYCSMKNIDNDGRRVSLSLLGLHMYVPHTGTHMWVHTYVETDTGTYTIDRNKI